MTYHNIFWQFHGDMRLMGKAQPQRTINKRLITWEKVNSKNVRKFFGFTLVLQLLMML